MCDNELLLDYLYDELGPAERQSLDRHLASCADCRSEVEGLRGTREHLALWAPPEPDLGFQVVRAAKPAPSVVRPWWRPAPAWGLAAAALVVLSVSAAVANLEVIVGSNGVTVRTGWHRSSQLASTAATPSSTQMERLEAKVKELETQLSARTVTASATVAPAVFEPGSTIRMSDQELQRFVRQQIAASEERQKSELAFRILQANRENDTARRTDLARISQGFAQMQNAAAEVSHRQRAFEDIVRVGLQR